MDATEFQQIASQAGKPVIVDFWAPWCAPCRATRPILEKLAAQYAGKVGFMQVNADDSPDLVRQFRVMGIPTLLVFQDGAVASRITGARSESDYATMFESLASGRQVKATIPIFDRALRLSAGLLLIAAGYSTGSWLAAGAGALVAFLGVYDRCPVWRALTGAFRR